MYKNKDKNKNKNENNSKQSEANWGIKEFIGEIAKPLTLVILFLVSAPYVTPNFIIKHNLEIQYILLFFILILYLVKCALPNKSKNKSSEK